MTSRKPKYDMAQESDVLLSEGKVMYSLDQAAKLLRFMGRNTLMEWLKERKLLLLNNSPAQGMIEQGYMVFRLKKIEKEGVVINHAPVTLVTFKGLEFLEKTLRREFLKNPII